MKEYRLLIVDSDASFADRIAICLSDTPGIKVAATAYDGVQGLNLLHSLKPDIVLLDPLLPELDGLSLMKSVHQTKYAPIIICISRFYTSVSVELARRNGASYYVYKPIAPEALSDIILECANATAEKQRARQENAEIRARSSLAIRIHSLMHEMGFSSKLVGSEYIAQSIAIAYESPMALHNITNGIYKPLAMRMQTSEACIERSIRTAITSANSDGSLSKRIGQSPTNKSCIRYLLSALKRQT